ncbi:helix-turn-helix domain-containing protein [Plebeiibacterium marinum]|uniref:Helix-turn-helix domain-containing protein n=1 Tax=Plebeiibacterium marinum TaxID=2992111 RepID=A0AAE3SJW4_9BACT|nr:helix-turn-helix domain-containing protein [Plebeiobacterium marinum]MCW3806195.1 helix-turn-helix domain-containing protein [Plebeiobacterium marinum]
MNVITIESEAYKALIEKIDSLSRFVELNQPSVNPEDAWIDGEDVCQYLRISQRTLQRLRSTGNITYSSLGGKVYYTIAEIKKLLENRKVRSSVESVDELCEMYKKRISNLQEKGKDIGSL